MLRKTLILISVFVTLVACDNLIAEQETDKYKNLCEIYKGIVQQPIDESMKEMKISEAIQKQLPAFYKNNYAQISTADFDRRYSLLKKIAKIDGSDSWECNEIKTYYEGGYDK